MCALLQQRHDTRDLGVEDQRAQSQTFEVQEIGCYSHHHFHSIAHRQQVGRDFLLPAITQL